MEIFKIVEQELNDFLTKEVEISEGYYFSQYNLVKRISLFANKHYPTGNYDKMGNYKSWIDIISPRIDNEVKNIDFDTKDVMFYSNNINDYGLITLGNLKLREILKTTGKAEEINDSIEEGAGWGNVVLKKTKNDFEKVDLSNFFVINQTAKTLDDSPVIERHSITQSYLRSKKGVWKNIDEVIKECKNMSFSSKIETTEEKTETPYYEVFERNGEVSQKVLYEAQGKKGGSKDKYVLARIILCGVHKNNKGKERVLFAEELKGTTRDYYKEYHRGRYTGRWFRVGIYELLFDIQIRANEISNQIARGLEWSSKTLFKSSDNNLRRNILSNLANGSVIKSTDLSQINVRMEGMDQLIADWNRLMNTADRLCNSYEVMTGESLPSGTSFKLGSMINQNATKLFDFIREKLSIMFQGAFEDWILPSLITELSKEEIIRLSGNEENLNVFYKMLVDGWYLNNLLTLPPHSKEQAKQIKETKFAEIMSKPDKFIKAQKKWMANVRPRISVIISGENIGLAQELETLATFIALEQDPVRRTALIEKAMKIKGINVEALPKTEQMPQQQTQQIPMKKTEALKEL
ncbi:MAG: hypothetical protein PHS54_01515 [Clostridia bacterium]|nr:hypothetical protein [Clostridia bacterium]